MQTQVLDTTQFENKIFDSKITNSLPDEFFEYITNIVANGEYYKEVPQPEKFENFIQNYKSDHIEQLKSFLIDQNYLNTKDINFTDIYTELFLDRYFFAFKKYAKYYLRRIQTPKEYGTWSKVGIQNGGESHFVAFNVDKFIPKLANGDVDFEALKKQEERNYTLAAFLSASTQMPIASVLIYEQFEDITERKLLTKNFVYGKQIRELTDGISKILTNFFTQKVYEYISQGVNKDEALNNVINYFAQSIFPFNHKFPSDMQGVEIEVKELIRKKLNEMKSLTRETKEQTFYELIESILFVVQSGDFTPIYYYKPNIREGSTFDITDYSAQYVLDLYTIETNSIISPEIFESYGIVVGNEEMKKIFKASIGSENLYKKYIRTIQV